jgi:serine/threonine protein kinase
VECEVAGSNLFVDDTGEHTGTTAIATSSYNDAKPVNNIASIDCDVDNDGVDSSVTEGATKDSENNNAGSNTLRYPNGCPRFDRSEIKTGRVVGRGGFCVVSEIREIRLETVPRRSSKSSHRSHTTGGSDPSTPRRGILGMWKRMGISSQSVSGIASLDSSNRSMSSKNGNGVGGGEIEDIGSRTFLARQVWTKKGGKFVIKQVNSDLILTDKVTFLKGVIDIAMEAKFLACLNHPNIIELRGESSRTPFETTEYFMILDYLPETLPYRLNHWMHTKRATQGITGLVTSFGTGNNQKVSRLMTERLLVAYDIAAAGDYLHRTKNVIFRDLKPDNVGFNSNGVTKLMDFGLARELTNVERDENGLYLLTGLTGGIRYMAPEVGLNLPYNMKADVYSWSMILWYIMALEPPLSLYTPEMILDRVFEKGHRPATKVKWSPAITELLRMCWSEELLERPSFKEIMSKLQNIVRTDDKHAASMMMHEREKRT